MLLRPAGVSGLTVGGLGVLLFEGVNGSLEADLTGSPVFTDLASWQAGTDDPGQERISETKRETER